MTGTTIYNHALALIGQMGASITSDDTVDFATKAPYLINLGQMDLAKTGDLYAEEEYDNETTPVIGEWQKFSLPTDFKSIHEIIFESEDTEEPIQIEYKQFGIDTIYLYFPTSGIATLLYLPIPAVIDSLTDTLSIDDYSANKLAYYLAWKFTAQQHDNDLADMFEGEYKSLKRDNRNQALYTQIIDAY